MRAEGANGVGRFSVEFEVANYADVIRAQDGTLPPEKVRREVIKGVVDSGATKLVLPEAVARRLGPPLGNPIKVRNADGRRSRQQQAKGVSVQLLGRESLFTAVVELKRETALVGAMVLEDLDLLVDCVAQKVVPRDPSGPI
jgi:predicted aspartyl protease